MDVPLGGRKSVAIGDGRAGRRRRRTRRPREPVAEAYHALVLGIRDYCRKCGFDSIVLGLSRRDRLGGDVAAARRRGAGRGQGDGA